MRTEHEAPDVRIFVSSPGDPKIEREIAERVISRLASRPAGTMAACALGRRCGLRTSRRRTLPLTERIAAVLEELPSDRTTGLYDAGLALGKAIENGGAGDTGRRWMALAFKDAAEAGHPVALLDVGTLPLERVRRRRVSRQGARVLCAFGRARLHGRVLCRGLSICTGTSSITKRRDPGVEKALVEDPSGDAHYLSR